MAPICIPCARFYRPEKNGYTFLEGMPISPDLHKRVEPGNGSDSKYWHPYKLWRGDLWKCEGCGHLTIAGVAQRHMSEHYMPDFKSHVDTYATKPVFQVNDCC